jgi:hypothetical protein
MICLINSYIILYTLLPGLGRSLDLKPSFKHIGILCFVTEISGWRMRVMFTVHFKYLWTRYADCNGLLFIVNDLTFVLFTMLLLNNSTCNVCLFINGNCALFSACV